MAEAAIGRDSSDPFKARDVFYLGWHESPDNSVGNHNELANEFFRHEVTLRAPKFRHSYVRQTEVANAAERPTENLQAYDLVREADCLLIHTAVLVERGDVQGAQRTMALLTDVDPEFSLAEERANPRFGNSPLMEQFLSQLADARAPDATSGSLSPSPRPLL